MPHVSLFSLSRSLVAPNRKIGAWTLVTFIFSLVILAVFFQHMNNRTISEQERLFNEQQLLQTYLAARGLNREFDFYLNKLPQLVQHPIDRLIRNLVDFSLFRSNLTSIAKACPDILLISIDRETGPRKEVFSRITDHQSIGALLDSRSIFGNALREYKNTGTGTSRSVTFLATPTSQLVNIGIRFDTLKAPVKLHVLVDMAPLIARYITPMRSGRYGSAYLLAQDGTVLFDHETEIIGSNVFKDLHADYPDLKRIDQRMISEDQGTGSYTFSLRRGQDARKKFAAWSSVNLRPSHAKIIVAMSTPDKDVSNHLHFLWPLRYLLAVIVTLLAMTLAFVINQILTNKRIEASRQQLLGIIDFLPDATLVVDKNHRLTGWNKAMERLTGVDKSMVIGTQNFTEICLGSKRRLLIHCFDLDDHELEKIYPQFQRDGDTVSAEDFIPELNDGKGAHVWFTATRLKDSQGNLVAGIECIRDITVFKKAELELKRSQERFSLAVEANSTGIWDWDTRTGQVYFSSRWKNIIGYRDDEFPNDLDAWKQTIHPDDYDRVMAANHGLTPQNPCFEIEYRVRSKDGSYKWIEGRGTGLWNTHGEIYRMAGSHMDISERKQNELILEALLRISTTANRVRKTNYLFREIHLTLKELIGADNFFVALWDPGTKRISFPYYNDEYDDGRCYDQIEIELDDKQPGLTAWVLRNEKPLFLTQDDALMEQYKGVKPLVWLGVPIIIGSQTKGILCVQDYHDAKRFREKDIDVLFAVAEQTALALDRKQNEDRMAFYALHDPLTDLPNRALFLDRLEHCLHRSKRHEHFNFAVMMIDLDRFKKINDCMGHTTGDNLLIQLAKRVSPLLRGVDTMARLGGDEFAVLVEDFHNPREVITITKRILQAVVQPFTIGEKVVHTDASIGIVVNTAHYPNGENIIRDADIAMYEAKKNAPGRFRVFNKQMHKQAIEVMSLENDLRKTLEENEIGIVYQPIFSLEPLCITGFEALARWNHPLKGAIGPDTFIPIAEETGLIHDLGMQILEKACTTLADWRKNIARAPELIMSVNVSARQLAHPHLVERIQETLDRHAIPGHAMKVEITESTFMEHPRTSELVLDRLKRLGLFLAVDDFGTGYSSLSYLQRLPVDTLKVDRSFIKDLDTNPKSRVIARAILALAHSLDKDVIAEGVETKNQLDFLSSLGCEKVQGFYLGKPLDREGAERLVRERT
jgi:diguanylate cyclase (GGDEF)-like protein/PAS domain S-box-containing protein